MSWPSTLYPADRIGKLGDRGAPQRVSGIIAIMSPAEAWMTKRNLLLQSSRFHDTSRLAHFTEDDEDMPV